ncbi:hypothetical protein [Saccharopolyspora cebuensis]|uniref:Uncharacterized protein n=1 Tax=Saccharopolyspora cebuensis TaxID=418759 RepID=A0ABV4CBL6_9PSEU
MTSKENPWEIALRQLEVLAASQEELTAEQCLQLGQLAAQIEIADRLRRIESSLDPGVARS